MEIPVTEPKDYLSDKMLFEMSLTQRILNDKTHSSKQKMCALALSSLINEAMAESLNQDIHDPDRTSFDYTISQIKEFYNRCKKAK